MSQDLIQTYKHIGEWKNGDPLIKGQIVVKDAVHQKDLLHLSLHLLVVNENNRILCRQRKADDLRYPGLWTTSIGTHVLLNSDYLSTLEGVLPIKKSVQFLGEFRVHDEFENEINGLYMLRAEQKELSVTFLKERRFFSANELTQLIANHKLTPHLRGALDIFDKQLGH